MSSIQDASLNQYVPKNETRLKIYNKFLDMFTVVFESKKGDTTIKITDKKLYIFALNIERAIFNDTVFKAGKLWNDSFKNKYLNTTIRIYINLDPDSYVGNKNLIHRLFNNEFSCEYLVSKMTSEEMFPEAYASYYEEQRKEKQIEEKYKTQMQNITGAFKCGKCKTWKTTYYQLQLRACDEPAHTFVTCLNCDNRWKFC